MNTPRQNLAASNRRRFRFGLRTLLAVVALAAVASWGYWVGWPMWLDHRERIAMEKEIRQFQPGMQFDQFHRLVSNNRYLRLIRTTGFSNDGNGCQIVDFDIGRAIYIAYVEVQFIKAKGPSETCRRLEFYRLALPPIDYQTHTEHGRAVEASETTLTTGPIERSRMLYMADFREFLAGDRKNKPGFQYELIYSDPPAKPQGK